MNNFKKIQKLPSENYVQFPSRLCASFDYYSQLHKVTDFRSLCDLIVSDRIFETLDRELMTHIGIKQDEGFFKPQELGRECHIYLSSRTKGSKQLINRNIECETKRVVGNRWQKNQNWRTDKNISKVKFQIKTQIVVFVKRIRIPFLSAGNLNSFQFLKERKL